MSKQDLSIVHVGEEPRSWTTDIYVRAGGKDKNKCMRLVREHLKELEEFGEVLISARRAEINIVSHGKVSGSRVVEFEDALLNEDQAAYLLTEMRTPKARDFKVQVVKLFGAWRRGHLIMQQDPEAVRLTIRIHRLDAGNYETAWEQEMLNELARLSPQIIKWDERTDYRANDKRMHWALGKTWRVILGDSAYEELRRRCPHPRAGDLYPQWIRDERMKLIRREDMVITLFIARRARNWTEYEHEMRVHFRRAPIQLRLLEGQRTA